MRKMPLWNPPKDIAKALEEGDGVWEDDRWSPIQLTAMSGTEYERRDIPIAWEIAFEPSEEGFEAANARLEALGIEPDGYGWGEYIQRSIRKSNPDLAKRLHLMDCEDATCVIWVETAEDCRAMIETTWKLIFDE
jgi:hypothetical protein